MERFLNDEKENDGNLCCLVGAYDKCVVDSCVFFFSIYEETKKATGGVEGAPRLHFSVHHYL